VSEVGTITPPYHGQSYSVSAGRVDPANPWTGCDWLEGGLLTLVQNVASGQQKLTAL